MKRLLILTAIYISGLTANAQTLHNVCVSEVASSGACGAGASGIFVPSSITISVGDSIEFETYLVALTGYNGTHNIRFNGGSPYDVNLTISTNALAPKTTVRTPAFQTAGTYTMECTNSNHCQIAQLMQSWNCTGYSVTVIGPTGVDNAPTKPEITFFPNPAHDVLKVKTAVRDHKVQVEVFNLLGVAVYNEVHVANGQFDLNTSHFSKGMYLLKVSGNGQSTTKQLIIE